jgi:hypothetical protein
MYGKVDDFVDVWLKGTMFILTHSLAVSYYLLIFITITDILSIGVNFLHVIVFALLIILFPFTILVFQINYKLLRKLRPISEWLNNGGEG